MNKKLLAYYGMGLIISAASLVLPFLWQSGFTALPHMVQRIFFALPWISVAFVLAWWRSREIPKKYPLAFVCGTITAFIVAAILLQLRQAA